MCMQQQVLFLAQHLFDAIDKFDKFLDALPVFNCSTYNISRANQNCRGCLKKRKIFNNRTSTLKSLPWLVSLRILDQEDLLEQYCSGTLIDLRHVLTAAHCMKSKTNHQVHNRRLTRAAFNDWNIYDEYDGQIYISIKEIIIHSGTSLGRAPKT